MSIPRLLILFAVLIAGWAACSPSEKEKARMAEEKRLDCQDKICLDGTEHPPRAGPGETVIKLNYQWYFAPERYVSGASGIVFYWPSKTPLAGWPDGRPYPERGRSFRDVAIEVFLTTRDVKAAHLPMYEQLMQAKATGRVVSQTQPRPGLEVWHLQDPTSKLEQPLWYVARDRLEENGSPPVLYCRTSRPKGNTCTTGFHWRPDISVDVRFSADHGPDWPEIHDEITRILALIRKA